MRSEQLESIVSLLRDSEEDGPTTVEEWRLAYDKLGSLVPPRQDIPVEPAEHVAGEWIGGGTGPSTGTNATTVTPGPWNLARMLEAADSFPMNLGFLGKGNASLPAALARDARGRRTVRGA